MNINTIFTEKVQSMNPYYVQDSSNMIKLDSMESPYKLPDDMRQALGKILSMININRYPNSNSTSLIAKIKNTFNIPLNHDVILGNGSDELIQIILMAAMRPGSIVMSPVPSFVMYQQVAEILGMQFIGFDFNKDFSIDENEFLNNIDRHQPSVIFLAYPNNPTGQIFDIEFIEQVLQRSNGLVVLDEAYTAYTSKSVLELIDKYHNAIVIRTFSKIGLAGIRLGYLVGNPDIVAQLEKVRMPYNINVLTQNTARFILDHTLYINACVDKVIEEKNRLYDLLSEHDDLSVFTTEANFLLVRVSNANNVFIRLRDEYRVLVKKLHGTHPVLDNILRVTIGLKDENDKFYRSLKYILSGK